MKKLLLLFSVLLTLHSCQDSILTPEESDEIQIEVRTPKNCIPKFTSGQVFGDLFGNDGAYFGEEGWQGTFESQMFPCPGFMSPGDCCQETIIESTIFELLPFSMTCNYTLDAQELQILADEIMAWSTANAPTCEGVELTPVDVNVMPLETNCCVVNPPCPELEDPCDCIDLFPIDTYFGCCETYYLEVEVKFARTIPCRSELGDFF